MRFHDLRHTFGSLAVDGGASLVKVQAWMGYADPKTTHRYMHGHDQRPARSVDLGAQLRFRGVRCGVVRALPVVGQTGCLCRAAPGRDPMGFRPPSWA